MDHEDDSNDMLLLQKLDNSQNSSDMVAPAPGVYSRSSDILRDMRHASSNSLLEIAENVFADKVARTHVLDLTAEERIPKLDIRDLTLGRVVGRGGFCVVQDVKGVEKAIGGGSDAGTSTGGFVQRLVKRNSLSNGRRNSNGRRDSPTKGKNGLHSGEGEGATVCDLDSSETRNEDPKNSSGAAMKPKRIGLKYVIKRTSLEHPDKITFLKGAVDLAMETRFLASLEHENVISLHAIGADGPFAQNYFLILEKLKYTLSKRIKKWMDTERQCKGITGALTGSKKKKRALKVERMKTALDISRGVDFLHEKRIIFRDLKTDNIGFNEDGVLKLFDFGLAKELDEDERTPDDLYNMTGLTGAMRYMAPEVGLNMPYSLSADVYSWSMIFWYILTLEPPFFIYSHKMISDQVFKKGVRPPLFLSWSKRVKNLLQECWQEDMKKRPRFKEISVELTKELAEMER